MIGTVRIGTVSMMRYRLSVIFVSYAIIGSSILGFDLIALEAEAQHHGAPPPAAAIGDRKVVLDMQTEPTNITQAELL